MAVLLSAGENGRGRLHGGFGGGENHAAVLGNKPVSGATGLKRHVFQRAWRTVWTRTLCVTTHPGIERGAAGIRQSRGLGVLNRRFEGGSAPFETSDLLTQPFEHLDARPRLDAMISEVCTPVTRNIAGRGRKTCFFLLHGSSSSRLELNFQSEPDVRFLFYIESTSRSNINGTF
jgi:hypothetical protein